MAGGREHRVHIVLLLEALGGDAPAAPPLAAVGADRQTLDVPRKGYKIPEAGRTARGTNIVNILPLEPGEKVNAMLHTREFAEDKMCIRDRPQHCAAAVKGHFETGR